MALKSQQKLSIFEYLDYRQYLRESLGAGGSLKKGARSGLAQTTGCQVSYVSRILAGDADFSLEQGIGVNQFLGHGAEESHFFLLLLQLSRAGTAALRNYFQTMIEQILHQRKNLKNRVNVKDSLEPTAQAVYYSSWHYAAIHVMTGIPEFQSREAMARRLGLPPNRISDVLEFLCAHGLAVEKKGRFTTGVGRIHLEKGSPMISRHHANWRNQAMRSMESDLGDPIHYSVLINVSKTDAEILKSKIAQFIQEFMTVVHPSKDEEMFCFNLDFFEPRRD